MPSSNECPCIVIKMERLPDTEKLSRIRIGGYQCVVKTEDWEENELAVHLPPDSIAPDTQLFKFLGEHKRIKIRRFCGHLSEGLLVKAPEGVKEGDNCAELLGITHYEVEINYSSTGDNIPGPALSSPKYDVENFKGKSKGIYHNSLIQEGEEVLIHEKLHGSNARYLFHKGQMWCGSRSNWKKDIYNNLWWNGLRQNPWIESWAIHNEDVVIYSEIFGQVQDLKYGAGPGRLMVRVFDLMIGGNFLNKNEVDKIKTGLDWVPELFHGPFNFELACELANEDSKIFGANHLAEGIVIRPIQERIHPKVGRCIFKIISQRYLER